MAGWIITWITSSPQTGSLPICLLFKIQAHYSYCREWFKIYLCVIYNKHFLKYIFLIWANEKCCFKDVFEHNRTFKSCCDKHDYFKRRKFFCFIFNLLKRCMFCEVKQQCQWSGRVWVSAIVAQCEWCLQVLLWLQGPVSITGVRRTHDTNCNRFTFSEIT